MPVVPFKRPQPAVYVAASRATTVDGKPLVRIGCMASCTDVDSLNGESYGGVSDWSVVKVWHDVPKATGLESAAHIWFRASELPYPPYRGLDVRLFAIEPDHAVELIDKLVAAARRLAGRP